MKDMRDVPINIGDAVAVVKGSRVLVGEVTRTKKRLVFIKAPGSTTEELGYLAHCVLVLPNYYLAAA